MVRGKCELCKKKPATTSVDLQVCDDCAEKCWKEELNAQVDLVQIELDDGHKHMVPVCVTDGEKP